MDTKPRGKDRRSDLAVGNEEIVNAAIARGLGELEE
jgi:hypothetical protein